ncbi:MAG: hypothetical protein WKF89_13305 [Chitinophagaceae bacterium]
MEKSEKKSKIEKEHDREQERLLSILPMRKHFLKDFFDFLDKHLDEERNSSLRLTEQFCKDNGLDFLKVRSWGEGFDAFTDQEILWNIEEVYEELMKSDKKS